MIVLAPMEGVVDAVVRHLLTEVGGFDRCVTEFIRVTDLLHPAKKFFEYCPELKTGGKTSAGVPVFVQLLGGKPDPMGANAALAVELGAPGIDLNFGCPAKTVNRHDGGAVLLAQPDRLLHIISKVKSFVNGRVPVTAKVRLGFMDKQLHLEIAQAVQEGGADAITIHARTKTEMYLPPAHWEYIARMKEVLSIPVIANGEIWNYDDYSLCRSVTDCEHFMIGRGAIAKPDLALAIKFGQDHESWPWKRVFPIAIRLALMSESFRHERYALMRLKQFTKSLARSYPEGYGLFEKIKRLQTLKEALLVADLDPAPSYAMMEI